ncbi:MAG: CPBP family intramembrane metalloprotease [Ruminococcus sp.]|nr:CPBP family intramembrane metalloprotease [Ruminococcus sp.]MDE7104986.1 CPBP family intramembrane metalloprotease [Ruminococcus sp.]
MEDYISSDEHRAQVTALNHEIYELTKKLEQKEIDEISASTADKNDPFENPTEYKGFSGSYTKILPELGEYGYQVPLEPDYSERKKLRKFYSIGGWCMIFQFILTTGGGILLMKLIFLILQMLNPEISGMILHEYMAGSSILASLNMLIYLVFNVLNSLIGLKWAGIKPASIVATKNFSFGKAVQYCMAALFIWVISIYSSTAINDIFSKYGYDTIIDNSGIGETTLGLIIMTIYTCIIAPITEEMFFRGMLLKVFSKANQRFAIFSTAIFFGLAHGNIPQFLLAFMLGILLAHITMKHDSIVPAVIVHIFINTFSTMFGALSETDPAIVTIAMLLLFTAAILGMIMLIVFTGENKLPATTPKQSRRGLSVAVGSLSFCASFIIQALYMIYILVSNS